MITTFIVANVRLYRDGLTASLGEREGFRILGCGGFDVETSERVCRLRPDTLIIGYPGAECENWIKPLADRLPKSKFVVIGCAENEPEILAFTALGVSGIVSPEGSLEDLVITLRFAARREFRRPPKATVALARCFTSDDRHKFNATSSSITLTKREREIAVLIEKGNSNKQIARVLNIQLSTVKNHVHKILDKLKVSNRGEAAAFLRRQTRPETSSADVSPPP